MTLALGVVVSHGFPVPAAFFLRYVEVVQALLQGTVAGLTRVRLIHSQHFPVDVARNEICRLALADGVDALLFLDCDMVPPADLPARLLRHGVPIVTARYHMRVPPYHPVAYVKHRMLEGPHRYAPVQIAQGLIEIERGGAGAFLVSRDVLLAIQARIGDNWFRYQRGPENGDFTVSEDFWFYQQAREAGFRCYCDWETECQHLVQVAVGRAAVVLGHDPYVAAELTQLTRATAAERQIVADSLVIAGLPDGFTLPTGEHVPTYQVTAGER